jgi:hypothetical protein
MDLKQEFFAVEKTDQMIPMTQLLGLMVMEEMEFS